MDENAERLISLYGILGERKQAEDERKQAEDERKFVPIKLVCCFYGMQLVMPSEAVIAVKIGSTI